MSNQRRRVMPNGHYENDGQVQVRIPENLPAPRNTNDTFDYPQIECSKTLGSVCCCIISIGILLTVILIPVSIRDIDHEEYGIRYEDLTKTVSNKIYEEGKYVFEPQTKVFKFSKVQGTIAFQSEHLLKCLSKDGIIIYSSIVYQYQLRKSELFDIFWEFGTEERLLDLFRSVSKDTIRNVIAKYEAIEFYSMRSTIELDIKDQLTIDFTKSKTHADITFLQLENYEFPDILSDAIKDKQWGEQDLDTAINEREGELTNAQTKLLLAEVEAEKRNIQGLTESKKIILDANADVEVILNRAIAESNVILLSGESIAISTQELWEKRFIYYETIRDSMGMTNEDFVNDYLYAVVLNQANNPIIRI
jgi:regulator of protease activity HflC (stomatin/prohibitin superfamily)